MKLLTPGTGNQKANRDRAIEYIRENVFETESIDLKAGNITAKNGISYHVSAYAETSAAFVSTPGKDKSQNSIYASGLLSLMYRQLKNDERTFIYEVDPLRVIPKPNSSTAEWSNIKKVSNRIWVCTAEGARLAGKKGSE